jgi:hypothetical protein
VNPWQSGLKNVRVKTIGNRLNARIRDDLGILGGLPYAPLGFFVQFYNVATNFRFDLPVPRECAVATAIKQLVNDSIPRRDRHSPLIGPLPETLTNYTRGDLKVRNHAFIGERKGSPMSDPQQKPDLTKYQSPGRELGASVVSCFGVD